MEIKEIINNRYVQATLALLLGITIGALFYPTKNIEERVEREVSSKYDQKISEINAEYSKKEQELEERLSKEETERVEFERTTSEKIQTLTTENRQLKQSSKRNKFKLVKPDGTIVEKEYEESNSEEVTSIVIEVRKEFDEKIKSTEDKWKKAYTERVTKIKEENNNLVARLKEEHKVELDKLAKERIVTVNERNMSFRVGYTSDQEMRLGTSYKLWGPFSLGGEFDLRPESNPFRDSGEFSLGIGFEF